MTLYFIQHGVIIEMKGNNLKDDNYWAEINTKLRWLDDLTGKDASKVRQVLDIILENNLKLYRKSEAINDVGQVQDDLLRIPSNVERNVRSAIFNEEEEERQRRKEKDSDGIDPSLLSEGSSRLVTPSSTFGLHDDEEDEDGQGERMDPGPNSEMDAFLAQD